jgi:integrase
MSVHTTRARTGSVTRRRRKDGTVVFGVRYWVRGEAQPRWELQPPGTSERRARARLQELSGAAKRGEVAMQRGVLFETYADRWLSELEALVHSGALRPATYCDYEGAVRNHLKPFFEGLRLDEMTRADCRAFTAHKVGQTRPRLAPKTINNLLVPLKLILSQAAEDGCTINSPELGIKRIKVESRPAEWYETAEASILVERTPREYRALIGLAVYAGLRQGEILALNWSDVDWAMSRIHVRRNLQRAHKLKASKMGERSVFTAPKTEHGRRLVPMRPVLRSLLEQHRPLSKPNVHDLVFANQAGEPLDATNVINRVYLPAVKRAGLRRIRFHDLRHTFVTYCAGAGVPLAKVGDWVGHSDARITEIYRHASADSEEFALRLLDTFDSAQERRGSLVSSEDGMRASIG